MTLQGKGFIISIPSLCEGGDPSAILLTAQAAGLSHVLVKIAEGTQASGLDPAGNDLNTPLVQALHAGGIVVLGWHTISGDNPEDEAAIAVHRMHELALDGYVFCAGATYEQSGKEQAARVFMAEVRAELSNVLLALSTYRFPNFHPGLPWSAFLEHCDAVMPQVYWEASRNAGAQLTESLRQYQALPNARPCIPTGAAYRTSNGWAPTYEDIDDFIATAKELGVEAINFFSWDACRHDLPQLWDLIAASDWPAPKTAVIQLPLGWPHTTESLSAAASSQSGDYPPAGRGQSSGEAAVAGADYYPPAGEEKSSGEATITSAVDHPPTGSGQPSSEAAVAGADDYPLGGGEQSSGEATITSTVDHPPAGRGQPSGEAAVAGADEYPLGGGEQSSGEATITSAVDYPPAGRGQPNGEAAVTGADDYPPGGEEQSSGEATITSTVDHSLEGGSQSSIEAAVTSAIDYPPAGGGQPVASASQADTIKVRVTSQPISPDAFTTQYLNALKSNQAARVAALYTEDAVHVRGDKVLNGASVIRSGYSAFFYGLPAGAVFELLGVEIRGDIRYLAWKAGLLTAYESIILRDGVIVLEYTYIE